MEPAGNVGHLLFAAVTHDCPHPPPVNDNPPFHVFMLSIGFLLGKTAVAHKLPHRAVSDGLHWVSGKKTPQEVIELIWGKQPTKE